MLMLYYTPPHERPKAPRKPRRPSKAAIRRQDAAEIQREALPQQPCTLTSRILKSGNVAIIIGDSPQACTWITISAAQFREWTDVTVADLERRGL